MGRRGGEKIQAIERIGRRRQLREREAERERERALLSFSSTRVIRQTRVPPTTPGFDVVALKLTAIYPPPPPRA